MIDFGTEYVASMKATGERVLCRADSRICCRAGADDSVLVEEITASDKAGIDCPLGWPRRFVEFVAQHQAGGFVAPADIAGRDRRRQLALRKTDVI